MGNCERLKWNRRKLGMTQQDFADMVGLSKATIGRLEQDNTHWEVITKETFDKISAAFDGNDSMKFIKNYKKDIIEEKVEEEKEEVKCEKSWGEQAVYLLNHKDDNNLTEQDTKTLTLVEFVYEGLKESKTHEEFEANINLLKRIIKKY